jgi:hypothetical protein
MFCFVLEEHRKFEQNRAFKVDLLRVKKLAKERKVTEKFQSHSLTVFQGATPLKVKLRIDGNQNALLFFIDFYYLRPFHLDSISFTCFLSRTPQY